VSKYQIIAVLAAAEKTKPAKVGRERKSCRLPKYEKRFNLLDISGMSVWCLGLG